MMRMTSSRSVKDKNRRPDTELPMMISRCSPTVRLARLLAANSDNDEARAVLRRRQVRGAS